MVSVHKWLWLQIWMMKNGVSNNLDHLSLFLSLFYHSLCICSEQSQSFPLSTAMSHCCWSFFRSSSLWKFSSTQVIALSDGDLYCCLSLKNRALDGLHRAAGTSSFSNGVGGSFVKEALVWVFFFIWIPDVTLHTSCSTCCNQSSLHQARV